MNKILKIIRNIGIAVVTFIGLLLCIFIGWFLYEDYYDYKFCTIEIPSHLNFDKPIKRLTREQIDSLKSIEVHKETILVTGGFGDYTFYMWHQPVENGEIYIKAFELTQGIQISSSRLETSTKNKISRIGTDFKLYEGASIIHEGTFDRYYPVRFELWFKPKQFGEEKKLAENYYVIDGWDR